MEAMALNRPGSCIPTAALSLKESLKVPEAGRATLNSSLFDELSLDGALFASFPLLQVTDGTYHVCTEAGLCHRYVATSDFPKPPVVPPEVIILAGPPLFTVRPPCHFQGGS